MSIGAQLPHHVEAIWTSHHGEMVPDIRITCPYEPDDTDKPCRIWADEFDSGEYEPGCWMQQTLEACGWADVSFNVPAASSVPWAMYVDGSGDDGPRLTTINPDVDIAEAVVARRKAER